MKEDANKHYTFAASAIRYNVGAFTFGQGGATAELDVKDDITSLESANLSILLAQAGISKCLAFFDWIDFIKEKKLERHFKFNEEKK